MRKAIQALRLPSTYDTRCAARGVMKSGEYCEAVHLHSSTNGHQEVFAVYTHKRQWVEVTPWLFRTVIADMFHIKQTDLCPDTKQSSATAEAAK